MARKRGEEYDWLNDPFDEKKAAAEAEQMKMSGSAKVAGGCLVVLVVLIVVAVVVAVGVLGAL